MKRRELRSHHVFKAALRLQPLSHGGPYHKAVNAARSVLEEIASKMRRQEIFQAGAKAKKATPIFRGDGLGSAESMTFFDGYASTHPKFVNPYRRSYP